MGPLFTQFVQSLGETPDERLAVAAWERLREILKGELKRRGLWHNPPSYMGIFGWPVWSGESEAPGARPGTAAGARAGEGALEELVAECYSYIFVSRLERLQAQLQAKPNIEGLILLNVRHFFLERQKAHDPLGYRVFEMVQAAVIQAIEQGEAFVLSGGDDPIRNETVLGFTPEAGEDRPLFPLGPLIARWNDRLLPELVLARGRKQEDVWAEIRALLQELSGHGVRAFRFRDILDPLKSDTRLRWAAILEGAEEGRAPAVGAQKVDAEAGRTVPPETSVESRESLEQLTRHVSAAVSRMALDARTRDYLAALWQFLKIHAGAAEPSGSWETLLAEAGDGERLSQRRLAELLEIPRDRLPGLFATLRRLIAEAQESARRGRRGALPAPATAEPQPSPSAERAGVGRLLRSRWEGVG